MRGTRPWRLAATAIVIGLAGVACGGSDGEPEAAATNSPPAVATAAEPTQEAASAAPSPVPTESLPPGAVQGLDDYGADGMLDPTCGTQDFGAGLVLRIPCEITTPNEPEYGSRLIQDSLYRLPGSIDINLDGISGSLLLARDDAGTKVVIVVFNSDNLFATGSDVLGSTDTMDNTIKLINSTFPGGILQVRGH
ncbi:OmpA family protein, partial [Frankia nepalensis]